VEIDSGVEGRKKLQLKINNINTTKNIEADLNFTFASFYKSSQIKTSSLSYLHSRGEVTRGTAQQTKTGRRCWDGGLLKYAERMSQ
jgi:hypothetical protein